MTNYVYSSDQLTPKLWMGLSVQSTVGCFNELCFLQFSGAQVLVALREQFINNFIFSHLDLCCWFFLGLRVMCIYFRLI